jgi:site-specific recombinase XerD
MNSIFTRVRENCELRNYSENTQRTYLRSIRQFSEYFMRSPEELGTEDIRHKAMLTLIYSAGLRSSEAAGLKAGNIDSARMQIRVQHAKGTKDRYTILSETALATLRQYWKVYRKSPALLI